MVADEVQRLAERSGAATKQIEVLVKTIQADTNDAVISMEQTTAEVVQGARLAQDAGVALGEIEEVSNDLAKLIQEISGAAKQQSTAANQISKSMNVIQEITSQTSSGTLATASSIGHMADMAKEMLDSVAGFKLPNSEATEQHEEHEPRGQSRVQDSSSAVTKEVAETQMASKDESTQNDDLEIDPKLGELAEMDVDEAVTIDDGLLANDETMETSDQEGRNASAA